MWHYVRPFTFSGETICCLALFFFERETERAPLHYNLPMSSSFGDSPSKNWNQNLWTKQKGVTTEASPSSIWCLALECLYGGKIRNLLLDFCTLATMRAYIYFPFGLFFHLHMVMICFNFWSIPFWKCITVHGMEYGFGAHEYSTSGVFEVEPKSCPGFIFRRSVWLGTTDMSHSEFHLFIERLAARYHGDTYHLIAKNCNHFTDNVCRNLTGKPIPGWVNRLARLGKNFPKLCFCPLFKFSS